MSASLIGEEKVESIKAIAGRCRHTNGYIAEVGVFRGGVLLELAEIFPTRDIYGYDTFTGLPKEHWSEDEPHKVGDFDDTSLERVQQLCAGKHNIFLKPGIFPDVTAVEGLYAFVHLDVDLYLSTKRALGWLAPRMAHSGVIVLDDWDWPYCPGVRKAVEEMGMFATLVPDVAHQAVIYF